MDKSDKLESDALVIGAHYETPDGRVVRTYGWGGRERTVSYYFDDGHGGRSATESEWSRWKPRPELRDFPNASDPRLPYVFDLHWDLKYTSELVRVWNCTSADDREEIIRTAREHEIPGPWSTKARKASKKR